MQYKRFRIRRIDRGDGRKEALLRVDGVGATSAIERELGSSRIEGFAVMEGDAA